LSSWLHGIALNSYRDHRPNIETRAEAEEFEAKRDDMDVSLDLEASIRRLPDRCREIFVLHDIEGYTHEEISRLLNIKNGTSKSQLFEARKKLREWLSTGSTKEGLK
jgi:RNA polymerase sigma-70 factor (ECF subfamily)